MFTKITLCYGNIKVVNEVKPGYLLLVVFIKMQVQCTYVDYRYLICR